MSSQIKNIVYSLHSYFNSFKLPITITSFSAIPVHICLERYVCQVKTNFLKDAFANMLILMSITPKSFMILLLLTTQIIGTCQYASVEITQNPSNNTFTKQSTYFIGLAFL